MTDHFYFYTLRNINYFLIKEIDRKLYLIKLDFKTTLKIALNLQIGFLFYNIHKHIGLLSLEEMRSRFNQVIELDKNDIIKLEKGKVMQNKLTVTTQEHTYKLYLPFRWQTDLLETTIAALLPGNFTVTDQSFV